MEPGFSDLATSAPPVDVAAVAAVPKESTPTAIAARKRIELFT
jgi:hypothetical protein